MAHINFNDDKAIVKNVPVTEIEEFLHPLGFHTRAKHLYKIRTKAGDLVNYDPWHPQKIIDQVIREEYNRTKELLGYPQVLIMYLKARQEGLSTDTSLRMTDKMLFNNSYYVQVLAHDKEGTGILFNQYERVFNNLPHFVQVVDQQGRPIANGGEPWTIPIKPKGDPTQRGIKFENLTESNIIVQTAGKGDNAGKAGSLNAVHYSENANYKEHDKVISSVNQQLGGNDIFGVKESTANGTTGIGEGFYDDWVSEEKAWMRYKSGENTTFDGWRPFFIPWYWLPKYRKPLYNDEKVSLDGIKWKDIKEKQDYIEWEKRIENEIIPNDPKVDHERYDVRESTNFYRDIIKRKCQRKLSVARRYYPSTPEEAFVTSDKCFFSTNNIFAVKTQLKSNDSHLSYKTGYINEYGKFVEKTGGPLIVKRFPDGKWRNRYVIGCDQSEGYEDGDYSCMPVFDRLKRDFPAYWNDTIPENELALEFNKMLYFWGNALAVPERNRMTVINLIKPDGVHRYMGEIYYDREQTKSYSRREPQWGYSTQTHSRKFLLDLLYDYLAGEENFPPIDEELGNYPALFTEQAADEFQHFIRQVKGNKTKYEAAEGYKDDIVIGKGLCIVGDRWWDKAPKRIDQTSRKKSERIKDLSSSNRRRSLNQVGHRQSSVGRGRGSYEKKGNVYVKKRSSHTQLGK